MQRYNIDTGDILLEARDTTYRDVKHYVWSMSVLGLLFNVYLLHCVEWEITSSWERKEAVVVPFHVLYERLTVVLRKATKNFNQNSRFSGRGPSISVYAGTSFLVILYLWTLQILCKSRILNSWIARKKVCMSLRLPRHSVLVYIITVPCHKYNGTLNFWSQKRKQNNESNVW